MQHTREMTIPVYSQEGTSSDATCALHALHVIHDATKKISTRGSDVSCHANRCKQGDLLLSIYEQAMARATPLNEQRVVPESVQPRVATVAIKGKEPGHILIPKLLDANPEMRSRDPMGHDSQWVPKWVPI